MPVLAQNVSLSLKASVVCAKLPQIRESLASEFPLTYCCDSELVRIGFDSVGEADSLAAELTDHGIVGCAEMALTIEAYGSCSDCDWVEYGLLDVGDVPPADRLQHAQRGSKSLELAVPPGWSQPF